MQALIRPQVRDLTALGQFPAERGASPEDIARREQLLAGIAPPLTDTEARALVTLFGPDGAFGLAWTIVHLVETAPGWPLGA